MSFSERLQRQHRELQERYALLSEKVSELQRGLDIEAGAANRFQLKKQLEEAKAERDGVSSQLEEIEPIIASLERTLNPRPNLFELCRFDLDNMTERGMRTIISQNGLIGFALCCASLNLLKQYCHRLKLELGRSNLLVRDPLVLHPKFKTVEVGVQDVLRHRKLLETQHVMLAVQMFDEESASRFWASLCDQLSEGLKHKLIILLAVTEGCSFPEGTVALETPLFERVHAYKWVREAVALMQWPEEFIDFWVDNMINECVVDQTQRDELSPDRVYIHLDETIRFIRNNPAVTDFRAELIRREHIYVSS